MRVIQQHFIFDEGYRGEMGVAEVFLAYLPRKSTEFPQGSYRELLSILGQVIDNLACEHGYFMTLQAMEEAIEKARKYTGQVKVAE